MQPQRQTDGTARAGGCEACEEDHPKGERSRENGRSIAAGGKPFTKLLPYEECREGSLREMLRKHHTAGETETHDSGIAVFIGPEGGFDSSEAEKAMDSGFIPVTLGPRILRTETAGVAVTAMIMYELGDMGGPRDK